MSNCEDKKQISALRERLMWMETYVTASTGGRPQLLSLLPFLDSSFTFTTLQNSYNKG